MSDINLETRMERARTRLAFERSAKREDYLPNSVGNAAWLALGTAIVGWVAGLDESEVMPVIKRSRAWLTDSNKRDERFGYPPSWFAVVRMEALGVACWLAGEPSEHRFREALPLHERAWLDLDERPLTAYVRDCALARVRTRRRHHPAPPTEDGVTTLLDLAAWICRHESVEAMAAARVLRDPLIEWLDHGQGVNAAAWIKLVFCDFGPERTPGDAFRTVRKFVAG